MKSMPWFVPPAILAMLVLPTTATLAPCVVAELVKPALHYSCNPEVGFKVVADWQDNGLEIAVYRSGSTDNLLAPIKNWHGIQPFMVVPWAFEQKLYPESRQLKVRGYQRHVSIVLKNVEVNGSGDAARFVSGKVLITWVGT